MSKKAYWIVRVEVTDMDAYKNYVANNGSAFAKYGARFLVRGGEQTDGGNSNGCGQGGTTNRHVGPLAMVGTRRQGRRRANVESSTGRAGRNGPKALARRRRRASARRHSSGRGVLVKVCRRSP